MAVDIEFLKELDRFRVSMKKRVLSKFQGESESKLPGGGLVFKDFSVYNMGDDIRNVDWNVYARTEKLFIKRFEEERNMTMHLVLDASSSMNFGKDVKKFDYAAMIGLGFAYMAMRDNSRFKFATFSEKLDVIKVDHGKSIFKVMDHLNRLKIGGKTDLKDSMDAYKRNISSRSIVVIVSDFLYDPADIRDVLMRYKRNYMYFVQVLDPVERELSLRGDFILEDMETKDILRAFISNRFRNQYQQRLNTHILEIKNLCEHFNAGFISVTTNDSIFDTFYKIISNPEMRI